MVSTLEAVVERNLSLGVTGIQIWRDSTLVLEAGNIRAQANVRSIRKSRLSALYGVAVGRDLVDLDQSLAELGIDDRGGLSVEERRATVRDLMMARSGIYHPAAYERPATTASHPRRGTHAPAKRGTTQIGVLMLSERSTSAQQVKTCSQRLPSRSLVRLEWRISTPGRAGQCSNLPLTTPRT